ncbi:MAG: hypothetical protein GF393_03390 [Armatimonadia bacterium]|nr:hypothetical protein [Armatimonadia bacterium]
MFELISWEEARAACEMLAALPLATMRIRELGVGKLWDQFVAPFDGCVTPYDAAYLLIASHLDCDLWTADDRLVRTVGDQLPWVRSLSELTDDGPVEPQ